MWEKHSDRSPNASSNTSVKLSKCTEVLAPDILTAGLQSVSVALQDVMSSQIYSTCYVTTFMLLDTKGNGSSTVQHSNIVRKGRLHVSNTTAMQEICCFPQIHLHLFIPV